MQNFMGEKLYSASPINGVWKPKKLIELKTFVADICQIDEVNSQSTLVQSGNCKPSTFLTINLMTHVDKTRN